MTKIDIVSGFLGAGKTTLIKKLIKEALQDTQVVLIENEFGEIGIDGGFLKDAGIEIKEMNSGCICCSLVGDFGASLKEVLTTYKPERVLIEPSGVGKLSDVVKAVENVAADLEVKVNSAVAVVDASKCKMYIKNFGEFFVNQIEHAGTVILSRTGHMSQEKLQAAVELIRQHNAGATIITTPWEELEGRAILETIEGVDNLEDMMKEMLEHAREHEHHYDENGLCSCGHHHHGGEEGHHHDHDGHCSCGHDHHHADEVFTSWGKESPAKFTKERIESILTALDSGEYGAILRAKGMVPAEDGTWIYYDYVPEEHDIRTGKPEVTGKYCVIGAELKEDKLEELFR
jgi:G3E family GTPase